MSNKGFINQFKNTRRQVRTQQRKTDPFPARAKSKKGKESLGKMKGKLK